MYKLYCDCCDNEFSISDRTMDKFIEDDNFLIKSEKYDAVSADLFS